MNIVIVSTSYISIDTFLIDHLNELHKRYKKVNIYIISNLKNINYKNNNFIFKNIFFSRKISIINDVISIIQFFVLLKKINPSLILSITPKVGLFTSINSLILGLNNVHYITGQVWANKKGLKRWILKNVDRFTYNNTSVCLCDSISQKNYLVSNNIINEDKITVLGNGSIKGVNLSLFSKKKFEKNKLREIMNLPLDAFICIQISRLNKDKGIDELPLVLNETFKKIKNFYFILIGTDEENLLEKLKKKVNNNRFLYYENTDFPQDFIKCSDISLITSYREGFCNFAIESSAIGLPVICRDIYGIKDAVINKYNGFYFNDISQVPKLITKIYFDTKLRNQISNNAIQHSKKFSHKDVMNNFINYISHYIDE